MANGELSLAEMRRRILAGNAISYRGRILKRVEDLPKESEHAVTLEEKVARAKVLAVEIDEREREYDQLMSEIREMRQPKVAAAAAGDSLQQQPTNGANVPQPPLSPVIPAPTNDAKVNPAPGTADATVPIAAEAPASTTNAAGVTPAPTNGANANVAAPAAEPKVLGRRLSYWQDLTDGVDEAEARKRIQGVKDMNAEKAQQVIDALKAAVKGE